MFHRCLSRLAAATAACPILFLSLSAVNNASAAGNIIRAAEGGEISSTCGRVEEALRLAESAMAVDGEYQAAMCGLWGIWKVCQNWQGVTYNHQIREQIYCVFNACTNLSFLEHSVY